MIQWRAFRDEDWPWVMALHVQQEGALGQKMDLPDLRCHPVLTAEVADRDGLVVGCRYFEAVPECVFVGLDWEVSESAQQDAHVVLERFRAVGFRIVRMEVPGWTAARSRLIASKLKQVGFVSTEEYQHFMFDLRQPADGTPAGKELELTNG